MNAAHDRTLATIERRALAEGVPVDELDGHVADVLRIPRDHYAAWQLVAGAIATYAHAHRLPPGDPDAELPPHAAAASLAGQLRRLWEQLGAIHEAALTDGEITVVREQARELIGELLALTEWLLADTTRGQGPADE